MFDPAEILGLLDDALDTFDAASTDVSPERGHQFRSHLATARMAIEHAASESPAVPQQEG